MTPRREFYEIQNADGKVVGCIDKTTLAEENPEIRVAEGYTLQQVNIGEFASGLVGMYGRMIGTEIPTTEKELSEIESSLRYIEESIISRSNKA